MAELKVKGHQACGSTDALKTEQIPHLAGGGVPHNGLIWRRQVSRVERPRTVDGDTVDGTEGRMGEVQVQASVQDQSRGSPRIREETGAAMCKKEPRSYWKDDILERVAPDDIILYRSGAVSYNANEDSALMRAALSFNYRHAGE